MSKQTVKAEYDKFLEKIDCVGKETISIYWRTGGSTGKYWGGGESRSVSGEPEPEFDEFDEILAKVWPEISFILYKKLVRDVVKVSERTDSDYYGNHSDYSTKTVSLFELFEALQKMGVKLD